MDPHESGFYRLRKDSIESVSELREFLGSLRGKKPQEVMGVVANNGLIRNTLFATVAICGLLFVTSAGVYFLTEGPMKKNDASAKKENKAPVDAGDEKSKESELTASDQKSTDNVETKTGDKTLDALGIGETKVADPDKNPLDSNPDLDNLLDGKKN